MSAINVRRLVAIDMYGARGRPWRRPVVLFELVLAGPACAVVGAFLLGSRAAVIVVIGAWGIGCAANYLALAWHAISMSREGVLEAELSGVDLSSEAPRYMRARVSVVLPMVIAILAVMQARVNLSGH